MALVIPKEPIYHLNALVQSKSGVRHCNGIAVSEIAFCEEIWAEEPDANIQFFKTEVDKDLIRKLAREAGYMVVEERINYPED